MGDATLERDRHCDFCGQVSALVVAFEAPGAGSDEYGPVRLCRACLEKMIGMLRAEPQRALGGRSWLDEKCQGIKDGFDNKPAPDDASKDYMEGYISACAERRSRE